MPTVFWTGKLTFPMWMLVNINNLLSVLLGNATNSQAMKSRVRSGYEGTVSRHVERYDELGLHLQEQSADIELQGIDSLGSLVLDVGSGTGVLALKALQKGGKKVVCGDISMYMLQQARHKPIQNGGLRFCQLDGEYLPFKKDGCFDTVLSGMTFGLFPNQQKALREMVRVVKPGGLVCIGAHGPDHYWEAIDGCFRCIGKRHILGYRLEFWPRGEAYLRRMAAWAGLERIQSCREVWGTRFQSGGAMYDFFSAISASWWYSMFPADEALRDSERTRAFFERKEMTTITDDVIAVWGRKA
jgi:ubiquinone/menaquinone biosynthesis C-methylase UbiE